MNASKDSRKIQIESNLLLKELFLYEKLEIYIDYNRKNFGKRCKSDNDIIFL